MNEHLNVRMFVYALIAMLAFGEQYSFQYLQALTILKKMTPSFLFLDVILDKAYKYIKLQASQMLQCIHVQWLLAYNISYTIF